MTKRKKGMVKHSQKLNLVLFVLLILLIFLIIFKMGGVNRETSIRINHTWSHAHLGSLSDEEAKVEIMTAKKQLEEKLGKTVNIFAYPYGSENQRIINILKQNGFIAALSTIPGSTQCDSFIMKLHRTRIGNAPLVQYGL